MTKPFLFFIISALLACTPLLAGDFDVPVGTAATRYSVLLGQRQVGVQTSFTRGGERRFLFEYNDRGRGPRLSSRVHLDSAGLPVSIETTGHDYLKNRVNERYTFAGGEARWSNRKERGERALAANGFYVSLDGVPEEIALLAQALLRTSNGSLPLLPEGEARIERMNELAVHAAGEARRVTLYAISGLEFANSPVWLDADGSLFAVSGDGLSVVRAGFEHALPQMLKAQEAAAAAHASSMARSLGRRVQKPLVIQHANLFDAVAGVTRRSMTVVVTGNRIAAAGNDGAVPLPQDAEFIDATGKTLIPGLWDMHAHLNEMDGVLNLAAGVTTVRDLGNEVERGLALRRKFDRGDAVGPRVILGGLMDAPGPNHGPTDVFITNEQEARSAVDRFARLGYEQVKVYGSVRADLLPAVLDEAHRRGLPVGGHIPAFLSAEQAVRMGMNEITHIDYLFLNFLSQYVPDSRRPARFAEVAEHGAELDLQSQPVRDFIELLKQHDVVVDPTLNVFENMLAGHVGTVSRGFQPVADRLPAQVRRGVLMNGLPVPAGMYGRYQESFRAMMRLVAELHRAGVRIVPGSDSLGGFPLQRELELYVEAGIPANEVLQLATIEAARIMKHDGELGSIERGKLADMALVDGDPCSNISDIRRGVTTIKNGVVYHSAPLYAAVGVRAQ